MESVQIRRPQNRPETRRTTKAAGEEKLRVAAYCRVSTDSDEQETSFETQVEVYEKKIRANPAWEYAGVYTDEGITGTKASKRPGFQKMIKDAEEGKIDRIITKSISRFARNTLDCIGYVRHLKDIGTTILFEKENIDTGSAYSEMLLTVLAAFAQEESRSISANITWGVRKRFEEGQERWANVFGYRKDFDTGETYIIVEEEAKVVRLIFDLYEKGLSTSKIGKELQKRGILTPAGKVVWEGALVRSILVNDKYCGDLILQKYVTKDHLTHAFVKNDGEEAPMYYIKDHHKAIVSREQFNRVQRILEYRNKKKNGYDTYPLGDKLRCPYCGKPMIQKKILVYKQSRGWVCRDHNFLIHTRHVEDAILAAYRSVNREKLKAIMEKGTEDEKKAAELFLKEKDEDFQTVEYYWVDELIDHIDLGLHRDKETRTLTVHWRCGFDTTVPTNIDPVKDDPEKLAVTDKRSFENKRHREQEKEQDLIEREA
ncbi:recombinase family protein [Lachnospiraceae bacterium YH-ros2226]|jgi:DNA invertase Pin-like site-specific DNA recombinase